MWNILLGVLPKTIWRAEVTGSLFPTMEQTTASVEPEKEKS